MFSKNCSPYRNAESLFKSISALPMEEANVAIDYYCNKMGEDRNTICLVISCLGYEER